MYDICPSGSGNIKRGNSRMFSPTAKICQLTDLRSTTELMKN